MPKRARFFSNLVFAWLFSLGVCGAQDSLPPVGSLDRAEIEFIQLLAKMADQAGPSVKTNELELWREVTGLKGGVFSVWSITDRTYGRMISEASCKIELAIPTLSPDGKRGKLLQIAEPSNHKYLHRQIRACIRFRPEQAERTIDYECILEAVYSGQRWSSLRKHIRVIDDPFVGEEKGSGKAPG